MAVNLSIKNASDEVVAALKSRARHNHRSIRGEPMAFVEEAAANGLGSAVCGEAAIGSWRAGVAVQSQTRQQSIEESVALMCDGQWLGGRRFTRGAA